MGHSETCTQQLYLTLFFLSSSTIFPRNGPISVSSCTSSSTPQSLKYFTKRSKTSNNFHQNRRRTKYLKAPNVSNSNTFCARSFSEDNILHSSLLDQLDENRGDSNIENFVSFRDSLHLYGYINRRQSDNNNYCNFKLFLGSESSPPFDTNLEENSINDILGPKQRKPIYESDEEILYPIYPISIIEMENGSSKHCGEILETSVIFKEPVEPLLSREMEVVLPYPSKTRKVASADPDNEALISLLNVQEPQVEYVFVEYDEDDDDVEDEQKKRQRLIQILCLGAIGLGVVTASSVYVAFYLNQISH